MSTQEINFPESVSTQPVVPQPRKWLIIVLGLLTPVLSFLYIGKGKWALGCFVLMLAAIALLPAYAVMQYVLSLFNLTALIVACMFGFRRQAATWWQLHGMLKGALSLCIVLLMLRVMFLNFYRVPSASMLPTIQQGSYLIVKRWGVGYFNQWLGQSFDVSQLQRGEVIVFDFPPRPSETFIKRVVALPGDKVAFDKGSLWLNGRKQPLKVQQTSPYLGYFTEQIGQQPYTIVRMLDQDYSARYQFMQSCPLISNLRVCTVPAGQVFVLGDNRDQSADSRFWGYVPAQNVIGKVIWISKH